MRIILKTIVWFSVVLFLIAEDKGLFDRLDPDFPGDELTLDNYLKAKGLLDRVDRLCEDHRDECRVLQDLTGSIPVDAVPSAGQVDTGD